MTEINMSNQETAKHLREWVKHNYGLFAWPTDCCGYDQHIKFVSHCNQYGRDKINAMNKEQYINFILEYANSLLEALK